MPIFKEPEYTIVMLGEGDITFGSGLVLNADTGETLGHLSIDTGDIQEVGSCSDADPNKKEVGDFPISITFGKVESVDVMIERLMKVREFMVKGVVE